MGSASKRLKALLKKELTRRLEWHQKFLGLAMHIETWSKDPSMKVGAVIVDERRRLLSTGYNGFPQGVEDTPERYEDRSLKYPLVVHAEVNAVLFSGHDLTGATLYCSTGVPCPDCMGVIIQSGIKTVVFPTQRQNKKRVKGKVDWEKAGQLSTQMAEEADVELIEITGLRPPGCALPSK